MAILDDPFSQVYEALWQLVERNEKLRTYLPLRNRIKYEEQTDPKFNISDADVPELSLMQENISFDIHCNSSQRGMTRTYIWGVASGDFRINPVYNAMSFELYRCMIDWESTLCELIWEDCRFVQQLRLRSAEEGTFMSDKNRGILGWSAIWTCEVDFIFPTGKLRIT